MEEPFPFHFETRVKILQKYEYQITKNMINYRIAEPQKIILESKWAVWKEFKIGVSCKKYKSANIYLTKGIYCLVDFLEFLEVDHYSSNYKKGNPDDHKHPLPG